MFTFLLSILDYFLMFLLFLQELFAMTLNEVIQFVFNGSIIELESLIPLFEHSLSIQTPNIPIISDLLEQGIYSILPQQYYDMPFILCVIIFFCLYFALIFFISVAVKLIKGA